MSIKIYTDGAYSPKSKLGSWAYFIEYQPLAYETDFGIVDELGGTTNQRTELLAALKSLETLHKKFNPKNLKEEKLLLFTDSTYLVNGITKWIKNWQKTGWKTSIGKPVKNKDIWERLLENSKDLQIRWVWVKGHSGNVGNQIADGFASYCLKNYTGMQ